eukprot:TRINITY_DN139_c0_g1_i4.p2 TRINITY_DN139_c0_g1~~TRINITY_DN139_c0_g1_i4.p2  ORF type:complete len:161 (+),score=38.13 TRINITY_DN139_c0_g1_i4:539-1021(+)
MMDVQCIKAPCDPIPTCVENHCATVDCKPGHDCHLANNGESATCLPWGEITCADKPCKAGYTCTDVKKVCTTSPCYQYDCSWPVHCTKEVMECPDGSFVGRDENNNCEFHPCPVGCKEDLFICPDGSSVARDPKNDCEFFPGSLYLSGWHFRRKGSKERL